MKKPPNTPSAGDAGVAVLVAIERHWPALPEHNRPMSVYYYITRNSGPFVKEARREITEAEWRAAVAADPDLAIEQPEESGPRGASCGIWAVWHYFPGGYPAWFVLLKNGDAEVKGMDEALFGKFKQLASALGARIFCETGEEFT